MNLLTFQIWCAAGVNLTGGRTKDGGSIVGASVFYSNPPSEELEKRKETKDEIEKLNEELKVCKMYIFIKLLNINVYYYW